MSEEMVFKRQLDEAQDLAVEMADHARDRIRSCECGGDFCSTCKRGRALIVKAKECLDGHH